MKKTKSSHFWKKLISLNAAKQKPVMTLLKILLRCYFPSLRHAEILLPAPTCCYSGFGVFQSDWSGGAKRRELHCQIQNVRFSIQPMGFIISSRTAMFLGGGCLSLSNCCCQAMDPCRACAVLIPNPDLKRVGTGIHISVRKYHIALYSRHKHRLPKW